MFTCAWLWCCCSWQGPGDSDDEGPAAASLSVAGIDVEAMAEELLGSPEAVAPVDGHRKGKMKNHHFDEDATFRTACRESWLDNFRFDDRA